MPALLAPIEKQRKQPTQARSAVTVDAILQACLQVLTAVGKEKLTTTLVAHRAGVSVGTLYQYFPNKRSLLQAVLRKHLTHVTELFEHACDTQHGKPLCEMITTIATTFFRAKMQDPKAGLALYSVSSDVDGLRITEDLRIRQEAAFTRVLTSSPEKLTVDPAVAGFAFQSTMIGVARRILEARIPAREHAALHAEMITMLCAYAATISRPAATEQQPSNRK
ncbi:MAG: TetR/AcrR family transcriptional regulator [Acidobacteriaceae bacterium]|nr:TetR/AcrR family transcriptional regulator [Acidobacteriaceae bacterium]